MYRFEFYFNNTSVEVSCDDYTQLIIAIHRLAFAEPATAVRSYQIEYLSNKPQVQIVSSGGKILYLAPTNMATVQQVLIDWDAQLSRLEKPAI